jgi:ATP-dependent Clp protease ATP-binding subunit ClpA
MCSNLFNPLARRSLLSDNFSSADLNKLTENAQKAVASAQTEATKQGHQTVEVEHLLHSLATQEDSLIPRLLEKLGAQPSKFTDRLESEIARLPKVSGPGSAGGGVYVTPRLQSLLGRAAQAAEKLKDEYLSVEHLLLAALDEDSHAGARITRLATGVAAGSGLEFVDSITLGHALSHRREL